MRSSEVSSVFFCRFLLAWLVFSFTMIDSVAHAATTPAATSMATSLTSCETFRTNDPAGLTLPLIQCFTDSAEGFIPVTTNVLMTAMNGYYTGPVTAMITMFLVFFGISIITGNTQQIKSEIFLVGFKIAGVLYFMQNASALYAQMLSIIQGLSDDIAQAVVAASTTVSDAPSGFCVTGTSTTAVTGAGQLLWGYLDCMLGYMFGFNGATTSSPAGVGALTLGIGSFLLMMFFSKGAGGIVLAVGAYMLFKFISLVVKFIRVYIESFLAFSFIFWFGFLFVPLIMFRSTSSYFQRWLSMCLLYILRPVLVLGFMGISLVILDNALFSGSNSVLQTVAGSEAATAGTTTNAFTTITNNYFVNCFKTLFVMNYDSGASGSMQLDACNPDSIAAQITNLSSSASHPIDAGILGTGLNDLGIPGSAVNLLSTGGADSAVLETLGLNLNALQCHADNGDASCSPAITDGNACGAGNAASCAAAARDCGGATANTVTCNAAACDAAQSAATTLCNQAANDTAKCKNGTGAICATAATETTACAAAPAMVKASSVCTTAAANAAACQAGTKADCNHYLYDVTLSLCAALLILYILLTVTDKIDDIVGGLVMGSAGSAGGSSDAGIQGAAKTVSGIAQKIMGGGK